MVISEIHQDATRRGFLAGVKAAFVISQLNRLGQVLCARCGRGFESLDEAWDNLELNRVIDTERPGYQGALDWGEDHPNYLLLACVKCQGRVGR